MVKNVSYCNVIPLIIHTHMHLLFLSLFRCRRRFFSMVFPLSVSCSYVNDKSRAIMISSHQLNDYHYIKRHRFCYSADLSFYPHCLFFLFSALSNTMDAFLWMKWRYQTISMWRIRRLCKKAHFLPQWDLDDWKLWAKMMDLIYSMLSSIESHYKTIFFLYVVENLHTVSFSLRKKEKAIRKLNEFLTNSSLSGNCSSTQSSQA